MSSRMKVSNGLYGLELYSRFFQKQRSQRLLDKLGEDTTQGRNHYREMSARR